MMDVKQFAADMSSFEVNRENPRACFQSGLFEETLEVGGVARKFYTYLKPGLVYNQRCLIVVPDDNVPVLEYLENSFWLDFADKEDIFLHILVPQENGWQLDGSDADYMNKVYLQVQSRRFYVTMQDNIYAVGIGAGATVAQQSAMKMTSEWSGLATFGDLKPEAMCNASVTHKAENMGKVELSVSAAKSQLPVWMSWSENTGDNAVVCDYWKAQNNVDPEAFSNSHADEIYFPTKVCKKSQINEEQIAQVRVTNGFGGTVTEEQFTVVWNYIKLACRHRSFTTKALRYYMEPDAYGLEKHTMEFGGFTRIWYEYVPASVKKNGAAAPLVVTMHGRGGTAESFISLSGMTRVAEERDFIVIFPEAGVYQQRPGGLRNILLWSGNYKGEKIDDTAFILAVIEDVKKRHNIDASRVYACGQSSGGMMASELAWRAPEVFAAVAPWSAIKDPDSDNPPPAKIDPVVPYMFLFGESDWLCVDKQNGELEYHVAKDISAFLKNLMKLYNLNETPLRYQVGEMSYYVYMNRDNIPLLVVGTAKEMSHANFPRESWISYDEFLAKFSKGADGTLYYMGRKV